MRKEVPFIDNLFKEDLMSLWCITNPRLFGIRIRSSVLDIALR